MHSDIAPTVKSKMAMETSTSGDPSSKKNQKKIPKRIHKAEREKMKCEHLNELFLALANSLELSDQNTGKASVLIEATRMVKDMLAQIECLRKENAALLSESQYVMEEKNELKDENYALEAQIGKLQTELKSKVSELQLDLNIVPLECQNQEPATDGRLIFTPTQSQGQIINPLHLAALYSNIQTYPGYSTEHLASEHISSVSKPHARYPTPADTWPSQVLEKQPKPVVSLVYPLYASIRAIETKSPADDQQWLTYWVLYSMITLFELTFAKLIDWLPFWSYAKLFFTCWLVIPYFSGAAYVYEHIVRPYLVTRQKTVNIWYVPNKMDMLSKPNDILTAAEKYIEQNGPDAFQKILQRTNRETTSNTNSYAFYDDNYRYEDDYRY